MSIEEALNYAVLIIENYQLDIENSKELKWLGIDLKKKGFCQGSCYKKALDTIEKLRNKEK